MDLDWCSEDSSESKKAILFNDNSIIASIPCDKSEPEPLINNNTNLINPNKNRKELNIHECFAIDLDQIDRLKLLDILNYLSYISNNLRSIIRNNTLANGFSKDNYDNLMNYLRWLYTACDKIKKYFNSVKRKESKDDTILKPFKTSSYKFCSYKNGCSIHKNKNKTCDKNHFVFEMVINDICKLIESLELITSNNLDNINWIFSNKILKITSQDETHTVFTFEKTDNVGLIDKEKDTEVAFVYLIDKNIIFKCFDVISYVLNKMFEESTSFLTYNIQSLQINI
jgi:hypothetical protein